MPKKNEVVEEISVEEVEGFFIKFARQFFGTFRSTLIRIISLKDSGKWVSLIVLFVVLKMFHTFLSVNGYSIDSMTTIAPHLGNTITWVFGIIAGAKTIQGTAEKIIDKFSGNSDKGK